MTSINSAYTTGGTLSSAGIGSGLDVNSIITSLMTVEKLPLNKLQSDASALQTKLSAFGQMQSLVSSFRDSVTPLLDPASYAATSTSSSDSSSVSASSTSTAIPGSYAVSVSRLASTQNVVSASGTGQFSSATDIVGTGTITISLGSWNTNPDGTLPVSPVFTPKSGATDIVIPVTADSNTLQKIADAINKAGGGVNASVVTDATGSRLSLQSTSTGASNGFRVTVADDVPTNTATEGLSRLAFDPQNGANSMSLTQAAADTNASINGVAVTTSGNTLTNVVDGMTFNLSKLTSSPVTVTVSQNTNTIKTALTGFVSAYNALSAFISSATRYDSSTKRAALLQGDAAATGLQNQLRSLTGLSSNDAVFRSLSDIGVAFQKDGTVSLNNTKVNAALQKLPELTKAMTTVNAGDPTQSGLAKRIADWADKLLGSNGMLPSKAQSIQSQIAANQKSQEAFSTRLVAVEARIRAQYTALDATMSKANALSQYVNQQITTWNKNIA